MTGHSNTLTALLLRKNHSAPWYKRSRRLHSQSRCHTKGRNPCFFHKMNSCYSSCSHSTDSAILTDMIYLYQTNAYHKFISFPRMYGRLPVKSHTSTLRTTWSPVFTEVPSHSSYFSSVGFGIATWKHL